MSCIISGPELDELFKKALPFSWKHLGFGDRRSKGSLFTVIVILFPCFVNILIR